MDASKNTSKMKSLTDEELQKVFGGKEPPVEGKKYADVSAADKPTIKAQGWNTKEKVTWQKGSEG